MKHGDGSSTAPATLRLLSLFDIIFPFLLVTANARRSREPKPAPTFVSGTNTETSVPISRVVEVTIGVAVYVDARCHAGHGELPLFILKPALLLFDEFPRYDTKDLIHALAILRADLMAAIPANVLAPEAT